MGINVDGSGKVSFTADPECDVNSLATYYPTLAEYQLPAGSVNTILRSEITELDRMSTQLDLVSYAGLERGAFKYSMNWRGFGSMWQEIHIQVIDDLNYKFGIIHQDVAPRNLFIDPATDNLVLFDFDTAAKIGQNIKLARFDEATPERKNRNDVKGVVLTIHELLTRDPCYSPSWLHLLDETDLLAGPEKWVKHPDVQLDPGLDVIEYYRELMCWVRSRGERPVTPNAQAPDWPTNMTPPPGNHRSNRRAQAEELNLPYIEWGRPRSSELDRSRRLLATGKYADEIPVQPKGEKVIEKKMQTGTAMTRPGAVVKEARLRNRPHSSEGAREVGSNPTIHRLPGLRREPRGPKL